MPINYLLELYPILADLNPIGDRCVWSGYLEIYVIEMKKYQSTYWTDWGGSYDGVPDSNNLLITIGSVLTKVTSKANLLSTSMSYYISGDFCYIHLAQYNYYYDRTLTQITVAEYFLHSALIQSNPSYPWINNTRYRPGLETPSVNYKLSDGFSGLVQQQAFSIEINNSDGYFDEAGNNLYKRYFNAFAILKRTNVDNPTYATDWTTICYGTIDDFSVTFESFNIQVSDKIKSFNQPACSLIDAATYTAAPDASIGKKIPKAWNTQLQKDLIIIDDTAGAEVYLFVDSSYYGSLTAVYDSDGNTLTGGGTDYTNNGDGTITMSAAPAAMPDKIDFTGKSQNLGAIITTEIASIAGLTYGATYWDNTETNLYIAGCPTPALYYDGDSLKELITNALKNDLIYLITLPDGRLTIRHYWNDEIYGTPFTNHSLDSWILTQRPEKSFVSPENWVSTVILNAINRQEVNSDYDSIASGIYGISKQGEYDCVLYVSSPDEPAALAGYIAKKLYIRRERIALAIGSSVLGMKLLDQITITLSINGRLFTSKTAWKIVAIDYAQDKLVLEEY